MRRNCDVGALVCAHDLGEFEQVAMQRTTLERLRVERRLHLLQQQRELKDPPILRGRRRRLRNGRISAEDEAAGKHGTRAGGHPQEGRS